MIIRCPHCGRTLRIPTERARPTVKVQCPGCRKVFALADAAPTPAAPRPGPAAPPSPQPAPAPPATPPGPPAQAAPAPAPAATGAAAGGAPAARPRPGNWRTCARHSGQRSEGACSQCGKGWCGECIQHHGTAAICPDCDALCTSTKEREEAERMRRLRRRPLRDELGTVLTYPLNDPVAYIMMAVVVGVFTAAAKYAAFGNMLGWFFAQALLYAYAFTAINRVSSGNTSNFMPEISDVGDLIKTVVLATGAMIVSAGPMILLIILGLGAALSMIGGGFVGGDSAFDQPGAPPPGFREMLREQGMSEEEIAELEDGYGADFDEDESYAEPEVSAAAVGAGLGVLIAFPFAALWALLYSPIALIAAAISRSFLATLNPITGIDAIRQMGSVYWEAWFLYTAIIIAQGILSAIFGFIPILGPFLGAFIQCYAFLSFGCLLGFAVFKKAVELGVD